MAVELTTRLARAFQKLLIIPYTGKGTSSAQLRKQWRIATSSTGLSTRAQARELHTTPRASSSLVLGIETSCDDTGAAVVDSSGNVLGEAIHSQLQVHLNHGGIIPPIARDLHAQHISSVVESAVDRSGYTFRDLDAIAVTVKPGLPLSLRVGLDYARELCRKYQKPMIPIHHMEAHALTARMVENVEFPFLVLLVSGGHCLLAIAQTVDEFLLLGESIDDAPGEAMDKAARRLKLRNIPELASFSGGRAIETLARQGNIDAFEFVIPMSRHRDCDFSFAGLKHQIHRCIVEEEEKYGIEADGVIPTVADLCASYQHALFKHICRRVQRGMVYIESRKMLPQEKLTLVVSGGVACNQHLHDCLSFVCEEMGYRLVVPPPRLCTDNGIMIAWNGMEKWKLQKGIAEDIDAVTFQAKCPLGTSIAESVRDANIKCDWIKLKAKPAGKTKPSEEGEKHASAV